MGQEPEVRPARRPGGGPRLSAESLRTRRITLDVSDVEWRFISECATAVHKGIRTYVRDVVMASGVAPATPPASTDFDTAAILTRVAEDLARLAEAAGRGLVVGLLPELAQDLGDAAHALGLRRIGVRCAK